MRTAGCVSRLRLKIRIILKWPLFKMENSTHKSAPFNGIAGNERKLRKLTRRKEGIGEPSGRRRGFALRGPHSEDPIISSRMGEIFGLSMRAPACSPVTID